MNGIRSGGHLGLVNSAQTINLGVDGEIKIGDRLIWEPHDTRYREEVLIVGKRTVKGVGWVEVDGRSGRCWDLESRIREFCMRETNVPAPRRSPYRVC